jgi:hypothetical protein
LTVDNVVSATYCWRVLPFLWPPTKSGISQVAETSFETLFRAQSVDSLAAQSMLKSFFRKLDRMLTAISYAEAGDLDAVKEMLRQDRPSANGYCAVVPGAPVVAGGDRGAKILEFKRVKQAAAVEPVF